MNPSTQFVEIVVIPSTGINYNLLLLDLQTDRYGWREREKDQVVLPSGRLCCWTPAAASDSACHSSVAEAPTNMPQILPDNTTHNEGEDGALMLLHIQGKLLFFCPFGEEMSSKNKIYCALKIIVELVRIVLMLTGFLRVSLTFLHQTMMITLSSTSPFPPFQKLCLLI